MKKLLLSLCIICVLFVLQWVWSSTFATDDKPFELIPETKSDDWKWDVTDLQEIRPKWDFWQEYNDAADKYAQEKDWLGKMLASGIVSWDTILLLLTKVIKFVSNAALVVGSWMFIYAWYMYIIAAISWDEGWTGKANSAIKNAVIWVVIVIFSYAIQKIVVEGFLT